MEQCSQYLVQSCQETFFALPTTRFLNVYKEPVRGDAATHQIRPLDPVALAE